MRTFPVFHLQPWYVKGCICSSPQFSTKGNERRGK